jgi:hypothetical protein
MMQWPVATLGYDDAGEGFSLSNNDLTITAAGQGLDPGDYLLKLDARYPATGCENPWYRGSPGAVSLRVSHTIDGVAPGQVIEGGSFRVYSRTWAEGETGWVFIDEDTQNPPGEFMYSGIVQPGGYVQITPNPADLNDIGAAWFVSVGTEEDGTRGASGSTRSTSSPPVMLLRLLSSPTRRTQAAAASAPSVSTPSSPARPGRASGARRATRMGSPSSPGPGPTSASPSTEST